MVYCIRRRVENVMEYCKTSIYIMFCGSVAGTMILPAVVYRLKTFINVGSKVALMGLFIAVHKEGGLMPKQIEKWFKIACCKQYEIYQARKFCSGTTWLHILTLMLLSYPKENNIFQNAVSKCHRPVPTARCVSLWPMKRCWMRVLDVWPNETWKVGAFQKEYFPCLLNQLCLEIKDSICTNSY